MLLKNDCNETSNPFFFNPLAVIFVVQLIIYNPITIAKHLESKKSDEVEKGKKMLNDLKVLPLISNLLRDQLRNQNNIVINYIDYDVNI
jgi:hypothetical protein